MRTSALARFTGGLAASVLGLTLLGAAPAIADEPPPPVVVNDVVTLYPGQSDSINVLANDSSPSGDDLALCRFPETGFSGNKLPPVIVSDIGSGLFADLDLGSGEPGELAIVLMPRARGTHVIDYYVCDHTHLVPATLTVVVKKVEPVDVAKVAGRPGLLKVTNHNDQAIRLWFGHPRALRPDGRVKVAAGETLKIHVQRHRILWVALIGAGSGKASMFSSPGFADMGMVRNIKLKGKPLAGPKKPNIEDFENLEDLFGRWKS